MDGFKLLFKKIYQHYIRPNAKFVWSISVALIFFFFARDIYFQESPLFSFILLGETLVASTVFLLVYFYGKEVIFGIGKWFENVVGKALYRIYSDFWQVQTARLIEAMRRENGASNKKTNESNEYPEGSVVLDTSTIIDGRIIGVIETGFLDNVLIVPQNVLDELQNMADKSNDLKRQKGRRGLDMLNDIKKRVGGKKFKIANIKTSPKDVDKSLVEFAKKYKCKMATVDYNLNKVAQVAGVNVLNINKLANEIKTQILPGEVLMIKMVQPGKEDGQSVGYLEDGTMIVVKNGSDFVGETKEVIIEKVLQTSAGRMVFANIP